MKQALRTRGSVALLALALVLALCCVPAAQRAAADQLRIPKIISILYDDSGSMQPSNGMLGKAGYAQYAVNALLALLDTEDVVYVTLMSHPETSYRLDMAQGQAQAIAQLNAMVGNALTPFSSLFTAIDTLEQEQAADASSLYWLVVFTDGGFDGGSIGDAEQALERFLRTPMPNGTFPQACFVSIGSDAARPERAIDGLTLYPAAGSITENEDIVDVMRAMADRISGRMRLTDSSLSFSGNTVTFTTPYPCFSFAFLQQKDANPWTALTDSSGNALRGSFTHIETFSLLENLSGWASKIVPAANQILPAGTYTLTFQQPPQDLVVMIEPALVLDLLVSASDSGSTDTEDILRARKADVKGVLHFWNDATLIDESLLPEGVAYSLQALQNGQTIREDHTADMVLYGLDFSQAETVVTGTVELPDIGVVTASRRLVLPQYTIQLLQDGSSTYGLLELVNNERGLTATILRDGTPLNAAEVAALTLQVETTAPYTSTRQSDGTFRIAPQIDRLRPLPVYGTHVVRVTLADAVGNITPSEAAWTLQAPVLQVQGAFLGTDTIARHQLRDGRGLLIGVQTLLALAEQAKEQVIAVFTIMVDGRQLTGEELGDWQPITVALEEPWNTRLSVETKVMADGAIVAVPVYTPLSLLDFPAMQWTDSWHLPAGRAALTCTIRGEASATQTFTVALGPWFILLLHILFPILILLWLLGYVFKRRFARHAVVRCAVFQRNGERLVSNAEIWQAESLRKLNFWSFVPYAAARSKACGLMFYAGTPSSVLIPLESLPAKSDLISKKNCAQYGSFACNAQDNNRRPVHIGDFVPGKEHRCVLSENEFLLFTADGRNGRVFSYSQTGA
jgi:hypothetical protein